MKIVKKDKHWHQIGIIGKLKKSQLTNYDVQICAHSVHYILCSYDVSSDVSSFHLAEGCRFFFPQAAAKLTQLSRSILSVMVETTPRLSFK